MMRTKLLVLIAVFAALVSFAQTYDINFDAQVVKNYKIFKKGTQVHVNTMTHELDFNAVERPADVYTISTDKIGRAHV